MARVELTTDEAVIRLSPLEKLGALHGNVHVRRDHIRAVRVAPDPWRELRGIRAPGTGLPGIIALGTRRGRFGRDFAAVYNDKPAVVMEVEDEQFSRLVVSLDDPAQVVRTLGRVS